MLTVDYTTLRGVAECSTKAAMTSVLALQVKGTRLPLEAGVGGHAALAVFLETKDAAQALGAFDAYYRPIWEQAVARGGVPTEQEERLAHAVVRRVLGHWFRTVGKSFPYTLEPGMTEIAVVRDLGGGVQYAALIDAIVRSQVGGRWFMDHKTTGSWLGAGWRADQEVSGQFVGQRWAGAEYEVEGVVVNGVQFRRLNTSLARCPTHGVPYKECALQHCEHAIKTVTTTQAELRAFAGTVQGLVTRYEELRLVVRNPDDVRRLDMQGRFNGACKLCDYRQWCGLGRPTEARVIDTMFEYRRWDPLVEAKARRVRSGNT